MNVFKHLVYLLTTTSYVVDAVTEEECINDYLPTWMDCYSDENCDPDPLPVPESAFRTVQVGDKGYGMKVLRESSSSTFYAVTAGDYWSMIIIDTGSDGGRGGRFGYGKKGGGKRDAVRIAIVDFPEGGTFAVRDQNTGAIVGSKMTVILNDLIEGEGLTSDDVDEINMIYSHPHFDHVGAATITYNFFLDDWGISSDKIRIIAIEGVAEKWQKQIDLGFFSYRAPLPTCEIKEEIVWKMGSTELRLIPIDAHHAKGDLLVYAEREDSQPAVMFLVDIVYPSWAPWVWFSRTVDPFLFRAAHSYLLEEFDWQPDDVFVAGHTRLGDVTDIELSLVFTEQVFDAARSAMGMVNGVAIGQASGFFDPNSLGYGNERLRSRMFTEAINEVCATLVMEDFGCKLAGLDVVVETMCFSAQSWWRASY